LRTKKGEQGTLQDRQQKSCCRLVEDGGKQRGWGYIRCGESQAKKKVGSFEVSGQTCEVGRKSGTKRGKRGFKGEKKTETRRNRMMRVSPIKKIKKKQTEWW